MAEFPNVFQPTFEDLKSGFSLQGKWKSEVFKNNNLLVVELGCGKGEYSVGLARKYPEKNFWVWMLKEHVCGKVQVIRSMMV